LAKRSPRQGCTSGWRFPGQPRAYWHGEFKKEGGIYSGEIFKPLDWTPEALEIRQRVHAKIGFLFDSLSINFYRHEKDHIGYHVDTDDEGRWEFPISSISLGVVLDFQVVPYIVGGKSGRKRIANGKPGTISLAHGTLVVMPAGSQAEYMHRLKQQPKGAGERINLTFRMMSL
jgi:alkylated DNA repair dioxygenase AlkB